MCIIKKKKRSQNSPRWKKTYFFFDVWRKWSWCYTGVKRVKRQFYDEKGHDDDSSSYSAALPSLFLQNLQAMMYEAKCGGMRGGAYALSRSSREKLCLKSCKNFKIPTRMPFFFSLLAQFCQSLLAICRKYIWKKIAGDNVTTRKQKKANFSLFCGSKVEEM